LDYRHLAEFTHHLVPTQAEKVFETTAASGNYAYMVDNRGFVISHPSDFHIVGLTLTEQLFQLFGSERSRTGKEWHRSVNMFQLGFLDPNIFKITKEAAQGNQEF